MSVTTTVISTKASRQALVAETIATRPIHSQAELVSALASAGHAVTQATLSRDLLDLGAVKVRQGGGGLVYALPEPEPVPVATGPDGGDVALARRCAELLLTAEGSANLCVLRTPAGAAQFLASAIDQARPADIIGTIAGDDTVLVVARAGDGGAALAQRLAGLARSPGRSTPARPPLEST